MLPIIFIKNVGYGEKMIKGKLYNKQYFKTAESAYKAFLKFEEELKICQ